MPRPLPFGRGLPHPDFYGIFLALITSDNLVVNNILQGAPILLVGTSGNVIAGPFATAIFNDANGDVHFTISDTVGLSMSVIKL